MVIVIKKGYPLLFAAAVAALLTACAILAGCGGGSGGSGSSGDSPGDPIGFESTPIGWASYNDLGQSGTTGGAGGTAVTVSTQADLERYAKAAGKYLIYVEGAIDLAPKGTAVQVNSDKTIVGKGDGATINYGGFEIKGTSAARVKNVIIRNLTIRETYVEGDWDGKTQPWDGITIEQAHHVWIDHCTLERHCDGALDIVKNSNYVTVSWCLFQNHNKTLAIGTSGVDTAQTRVTIHHNWFNGTNQRNPRINNGEVHVFNNYYTDIGQQGGYVATVEKDGELYFEGNYLKNCSKTLLLSDDTANIYQTDNQWVNCGTPQTQGTVFSPSSHYNYTCDPASGIPALVQSGAGRGKIAIE